MVDGADDRLPEDGPGSLAARFWPYVDRSAGPEGCWLWTRWCDDDGYGIVCIGPRRLRAHRVAWSLTQGPIPPDKLVLHNCDNPPCCNPFHPAHLYLGDHSDNQMDTHARGRRSVFLARRAEAAGQMRLTLDDDG